MKTPVIYCDKCGSTNVAIDYHGVPDRVSINEAAMHWGHVGTHDSVTLRCENMVPAGKDEEGKVVLRPCGMTATFPRKNFREMPFEQQAEEERVEKLTPEYIRTVIVKVMDQEYTKRATFQAVVEQLEKKIKDQGGNDAGKAADKPGVGKGLK